MDDRLSGTCNNLEHSWLLFFVGVVWAWRFRISERTRPERNALNPACRGDAGVIRMVCTQGLVRLYCRRISQLPFLTMPFSDRFLFPFLCSATLQYAIIRGKYSVYSCTLGCNPLSLTTIRKAVTGVETTIRPRCCLPLASCRFVLFRVVHLISCTALPTACFLPILA